MDKVMMLGIAMVLCCFVTTDANSQMWSVSDSNKTVGSVSHHSLSNPGIAELRMEAMHNSNLLSNNVSFIDDTQLMDMLYTLITCYDCMSHDEQVADYINQTLSYAEQRGNKEMIAVAIFNIGKSEYDRGSKENGYRHMEAATRILEKSKPKGQHPMLNRHYCTLLQCYENDNMGNKALQTLEALVKTMTSGANGPTKEIDDLDDIDKRLIYGHYTLVYHILGRNVEADKSYDKFIALDKSADPYSHIVVPYLFDKQMYDDVVRITNLREQKLRSTGDTVNLSMDDILFQLGRAYYEIGDHKAAADNFAQLATSRDSLMSLNRHGAIFELAEKYDRSQKDKIIKHQQQRVYILRGLIAILLVGGTILTFRLLRYRNHRRNSDTNHSNDDIKTPQKKSNNRDNHQHPNKSDLEKEQIMRLVDTIDVERLFLNPGLAQKDVVKFVHIPPYQFGAVFKRHTGETFAEHINRKRMEYAIMMLTTHHEYTVEAIGEMCGIKSKQHFHRQFAAYTGLTPASYRNKTKSPSSETNP